MKLSTWLSEKRGRASELAKTLAVTPVTIHNWAFDDDKQVPSERCPDIEQATFGEVRCEDLRPDLAEKWNYLRGTAKVAA